MYNGSFSVIMLIILSFALGCGGNETPNLESPLDSVDVSREVKPGSVANQNKTPLIAPPLWQRAGDVKNTCTDYLKNISNLRQSLVEVTGDRNLGNTLKPINEMYTQIDTIWSMIYLYMSVHPQSEVRTAAEECEQKISKLASDIFLDRTLYDAIATVNPEGLDPKAKRFLEHLLRDYRLAGVNKNEATRAKIAELNAERTSLRQAFSRALKEDARFFEVTKKELKGMPEDFIKTHGADKNGKIRIGTDRPTVNAIMAYADNENVRKTMTKTFLRRGYPANKTNLEKLLKLRFELANELGFDDWASYNAADKMAQDKKTIIEFLDTVANITRPAMERELATYLAVKIKDNKKAKRIYEWDRTYYGNKVSAEKFDLNPRQLRAYFNYNGVKDGILAINEELFGLQFKKTEDAPVWHTDVEVYDVFEREKHLGRFYLDMHPRSGKYDYAMEQPMIPGVRGKQLPVASLVCNFPKPSEDNPALMEHSDVKLFFHEFGHLMHQLLAGDSEWVTMSGINCESDFAEAPAQLLEEWAYEPEVLRRFAIHHETGETIPEELIEKLRNSSEIDKGLYVMRQLFYAAVSLNLHVGDPGSFELNAVVKDAKKQFSPYPFIKDTYVYASFTHLTGYTSMCYSYIWTLAMAKDLFSKFAAAPSVMDKDVSRAYRNAILDPGGNVDASEMMADFLGRDYSFDAFRKWIEN